MGKSPSPDLTTANSRFGLKWRRVAFSPLRRSTNPFWYGVEWSRGIERNEIKGCSADQCTPHQLTFRQLGLSIATWTKYHHTFTTSSTAWSSGILEASPYLWEGIKRCENVHMMWAKRYIKPKRTWLFFQVHQVQVVERNTLVLTILSSLSSLLNIWIIEWIAILKS